jgi:GntR family transcriptional regulator
MRRRPRAETGENPGVIAASIARGLSEAPESSTPLYMQLAGAIRAAIDARSVKGGEALPSERELMAATGLSRVTVRRSIDHLHHEGLLTRRHGSGTFVAPQIDQPLSLLIGFSDDMQRRGATATSILLEKTMGPPAPEEALRLGLMAGEQVVRLSRVRLSDGEPLAVEHAVVPAAYIHPDEIGDSLYGALAAKGLMPVRALQRLHALPADKREARLLRVAPGAAILHIERRSFLANGRTVEVTRSVYRGDRYDFIAELRLMDDGQTEGTS